MLESIKKELNLDKGIIPNRFRIYYSNEFRKLLSKMNSPLASKVLKSECVITKKDWGFLTIDPHNNILVNLPIKSFVKKGKIKYDINDLNSFFNVDGVIYTEFVNDVLFKQDYFFEDSKEIRIGRFVKDITDCQNDKELEDFVNEFKSMLTNDEIEVVEGKDIAKWYQQENNYSNNGTLGTSCMKSKSPDYFKLYTENPNVCKMIIVKKFGFLVARALVWKISDNPLGIEWVVDRQYVFLDHYCDLIKKWAIQQGWAIKLYNKFDKTKDIIWKSDIYTIDMEVQLENWNFDKYPYLDTFKRLNPNNGVLYNHYDCESVDQNRHLILENTSGEGRIIESIVHSTYFNIDIPIREALYSDALDIWIPIDKSISVYERGPYPIGHSSILEYEGTYYHKNDFVYSKILEKEIPRYLLNETIVGVENNGEFIIDYTPLNNPKYISLKNFVDEKWIILFDSIYMYIDKDLLVYINGKPIPKFLQMKCYMLKTPSIDIDSLSKIDGYILGVELDLTNSFDSNWAKYESDMLGKTVNSMQEMGYDRIYEIINTYDEYHKDSGFTLDDFKFRLKILNFFRVSLRNIQRVSRQVYEASTITEFTTIDGGFLPLNGMTGTRMASVRPTSQVLT